MILRFQNFLAFPKFAGEAVLGQSDVAVNQILHHYLILKTAFKIDNNLCSNWLMLFIGKSLSFAFSTWLQTLMNVQRLN